VSAGRSAEEVEIHQPVDIEVEYSSLSPGSLRPYVNLHVFNDQGICLFVTSDYNNGEWRNTPRHKGVVRASVTIPGHFLAEGRIVVTAAVSTLSPTVIHAMERDAVAFQVVDRTTREGVRGEWVGEFPGVVRPMLRWKIETL
jgi:lipopolysaccharide transport system ATP-binding protein